MFNRCDSVSPVLQDFIWVAEYYNGYTSEFDFITRKENSFYNINREKLVRFGLIGKRLKMWFECYRGTFNVAGKRFDIVYKEGDTLYYLTGQDVYHRDIITFKQAYSDAVFGGRAKKGKFKSTIIAYFFGYKSELKIKDVTFNFKPIVKVSADGKIFLDLHLVADRDLNGELLFLREGNLIESFSAPLEKNVGGGMCWIIK